MSSAEHQRLIADFVEMTHATEAQARFTLEAHNWQMDAAVSSYYEEGAMEEGDPDYEPSDEEMSPAPPTTQQRGPPAMQQSQPPPPKKPASRFATLNDFRSDDEEDEDKSKAKQQYFAGGSERSGQMIEGPAKKDKPDDFVSSIFEKARSAGREVKPEEDSNRWKAFGGQGSKLGEDEGPSEAVGAPMQGDQRPPATVHNLVFWSEGFTVNDGDLRRYDDPANREFLADVDKGLAPQELARGMTPGQNAGGVEIRIHDRKHEDYVPPKKTVKAFVGSGQRLGSPVPSVKSNTQTAAPMAAPDRESSGPSVTVDESKPTTSIQIRLADGTRMVAKLNHTHTVGDIRSFVSASRPGMGQFVLMTTFPNKELTDDGLTLSDAKLLNAVIVQKMK